MIGGEVAKARVRDEYDHLADHYERRWQKYIRMAISAGESLLDVGCGTGTLLREVVGGVRLAGVDLSIAMIARARSSVGPAALLAVADAERLPFERASFDVIVFCSSFHFFPSPVEALEEVRRVLRPGGRVIMTDWCADFLASRLVDRFLRWHDPAHQRIYSQEECARLLRQSGLRVLAVEKYKISWLWGVMTAVAEH